MRGWSHHFTQDGGSAHVRHGATNPLGSWIRGSVGYHQAFGGLLGQMRVRAKGCRAGPHCGFGGLFSVTQLYAASLGVGSVAWRTRP